MKLFPLHRPKRNKALIGIGAIFVALGACQSTTDSDRAAEAAATLAKAAAAITGQDAPMADAYLQETGRHVGFDTYTYPGHATMLIWRQANYRWVGYYLPEAPCHRGKSWAGKRDTLRAMGWGLAVVYVGQQTWGRNPRSLKPAQLAALEQKTTCSTEFLSAQRGVVEADDAVQRMAAEGFPKGSVIFLDVERMERIPQRMREYYVAWTRRVIENGQYRPGVYTHAHNAQAIYDDVKRVFAENGIREEPRFWIAGGSGFHEGRAPQDVGFAFAGVWQGVIDVARSVKNVKLPVDLNVAAWASPSETGAEAAVD